MTWNTRPWLSRHRITATDTRMRGVPEAAAAASWRGENHQKRTWHPGFAWLVWGSHWPSAQLSTFDPNLHESAGETMTLKTHPMLRLATAALLLAASSSAMAQSTSSNLKFAYVSSTAIPGSGSCAADDPCSLQDVANRAAQTGRGDLEIPPGRANSYTAYLLAAGTYTVPLNFLERRQIIQLYGGFPADFAGAIGQTDASFPLALAARDLKKQRQRAQWRFERQRHRR